LRKKIVKREKAVKVVMKLGSFFFVVLLFLSACTGGGYKRPYIISDTTEEAISSEPIEKR
jgi:hypothetical protein